MQTIPSSSLTSAAVVTAATSLGKVAAQLPVATESTKKNLYNANMAARRDDVIRRRSAFTNRFIPIPIDSFGAPFNLRTAIPLVKQLVERNEKQILHFNPCFLTVGEVVRLFKHRPTPGTVVVSTSKDGDGDNNRKYQQQQQDLQRKDIENLFEKNIINIMFYNETTLFNLESIHGTSELVASCLLESSSNNNNNNFSSYHRIWHQSRWFVAGAGKNCKPFYHCAANDNNNNKKSSRSLKNHEADSDTSQLFFSHESFPAELEKVFQRHRFRSRLWSTPASLPRTLAAANGESNRIMVPFALPKKLIPGYILEPRFENNNSGARNEDRYRIGRPFHFWARSGLRINFADGDFEKLYKFLRSSVDVHGQYAWFSSLDLKLFGYKVRPGEQSLIQFAEERLVTCVPLCPPFVSSDQIALLDASGSVPSPPMQKDGMLRILRSDYRWTSIPLNRVELPCNEEDAESVRTVPVADSSVFTSLGIKPDLPPLVLSMKIPVAAFNVTQLEPLEAEEKLPAPWMM
jgi:hypothetical protein